MQKEEIDKFFGSILKQEPDVSSGVAAIRTLLKVLECDKSETVQELDSNLRLAVDTMTNTDYPVTAVASGCELFKRFITLAKLDTKYSVKLKHICESVGTLQCGSTADDGSMALEMYASSLQKFNVPFDACKSIMVNRGKLFLQKLVEARGKVACLASQFIIDGCCILTHSKSRVVLETMQLASKTKHFRVYVTESAPDKSGINMVKQLEAMGISCTIILDSAVAYVMEQIDMVMVGAEGVVESGGIINKIGSYTIALCAREMKKPFYVLTESFKFSRVYPLSQQDVPNEFKYTATKRRKDTSKEHPLVDYTPPVYITLLFTDLGILTPSAVSDELIKLYL